MWLYASECKGGGLSAWNDNGMWQAPYPEVTGYCIPTLLHWNACDLAERCANWLLTVQNRDGSFDGIDGNPRAFDTSAIAEGLMSYFAYTGDIKYYDAINRAAIWMKGQVTEEGYLKNSIRNSNPETYNLRASAIIHNAKELEYRKRVGFPKVERVHYLAYALEGALNLGAEDWVKPQLELAYNTQTGLFPFWIDRQWNRSSDESDYCATAQMGILFHRVGLDATRYYRLLEQRIEPNGGLCQGDRDKRQILWACKFWLDFKRAVCG